MAIAMKVFVCLFVVTVVYLEKAVVDADTTEVRAGVGPGSDAWATVKKGNVGSVVTSALTGTATLASGVLTFGGQPVSDASESVFVMARVNHQTGLFGSTAKYFETQNYALADIKLITVDEKFQTFMSAKQPGVVLNLQSDPQVVGMVWRGVGVNNAAAEFSTRIGSTPVWSGYYYSHSAAETAEAELIFFPERKAY